MISFRQSRSAILALMLVMPASQVLAEAAKSGYEYIKPATRAMQDDEFENPGMLAVEHGQELFKEKQPGAGKSCAECHDENGLKLDRKSLARYPLVNEEKDGIVTLQQTISICRNNTGSEALPTNHPDLIALETFVRNRAFGKAVNVQTDGAAAELLSKGEKIYQTRYGLIDMSCAHCHSMYPGQMIRGQKISQGQGNGFPAYRLGYRRNDQSSSTHPAVPHVHARGAF